MYYILSIFTGILIAVMVVYNGELAKFYGIYTATLIIYIIGFTISAFLLLIKRDTKKIKKDLPLYLYIGGGIMGVLTTVFNNIAFMKLSVSALLALGLLGQSITSIIIDNYGFFEMPKLAFKKEKFIGLLFLIIGIGTMLTLKDLKMAGAIFVSLITGLTVVLSRTISARLSDETSMSVSVFFNYASGLILSLIIVAILAVFKKESFVFGLPSNNMIFLGSILSIIVIALSNLTVTKISSFYMTLLLFIGQIGAGIVLDIILTKTFFWGNLVGGIFVAIGLTVNMWLDKKI